MNVGDDVNLWEHKGRGVDESDCKESARLSENRAGSDDIDRDDISQQDEVVEVLDPTDSSVGLVSNQSPHQQDEEWVEVHRRKSKK